MMRTTLELAATNVELEGAQLQYAAIPLAYPAVTPFDFRIETTRPLFHYGYDCARAGRLWIFSRPAGEQERVAASAHIPCPVEAGNELIDGVSTAMEGNQ